MAERFLVVVPTYNERVNLPLVVPAILSRIRGWRFWSWTTTRPTAPASWPTSWRRRTPRVHVLHRPAKSGLGKAYLAGFRWALDRGYELIFEMDADFSHDPKFLGEFLRAASDADVVHRLALPHRGERHQLADLRLLLSIGANEYARWITGLPLADSTGGFKCFRREVLEAIDLEKVRSNGYCLSDRDELPGLEEGLPAAWKFPSCSPTGSRDRAR